MIDLDRLLALIRALNREGVEYVVIGAVALGLHGLARATEDVDLVRGGMPVDTGGRTAAPRGRRPPPPNPGPSTLEGRKT